MYIGVGWVALRMPENASLKDKRQVVRGIKDRMRDSFSVSAAEVDGLEDHKLAVLGFAIVSNEHSHARGVLEQVASALRSHPVAEFLGMDLDAFTVD